VNKKSADYERATGGDEGAGGTASKWSLAALWAWFAERGVDPETIKAQIADIVVKTLISAEPKIVGKINSYRVPRGACFELYGYDILLDENLRAWLVEVNCMCSLASSSPFDKRVKHTLMTDILHLVSSTTHARPPAHPPARPPARLPACPVGCIVGG
jgi:hypothetical protein